MITDLDGPASQGVDIFLWLVNCLSLLSICHLSVHMLFPLQFFGQKLGVIQCQV